MPVKTVELGRFPPRRRGDHRIANSDYPRVLDDAVHPEIRRSGAGTIPHDEPQCVDRASSRGRIESDDGTARIAGHDAEPYLGPKLDHAAEPLVLLVRRAAAQQDVGTESSTVEWHSLARLLAQVGQRRLRQQGHWVLVITLPRLVRPHQPDRLATHV